jgi:tetratricopeptide (TPR) repeat protein
MAHEEGLPGIGSAQEIGQDATRCLYTNSPKNWVTPKDLGGTDDYGLDFQIQLKIQSQAAAIFRLQLKGTKSPRLVEGGRFISIPLSASTLRYYRNIAEPILLVVCDLSVSADPRQCPLYFVWVREELRRIDVDSLDLDQEEATLRVPTANQLAYELDLLPDVRNANELAEAGHALDMRVTNLRPELQPEQRVEIVHNVTKGFNKRSAAFLEAVAAPASEHWPKPEAGTLAADLVEAARLLKTGKVDKAAVVLNRAEEKLKEAVDLELGEYHFLRGREAMLNGNDAAASLAFLIAAQTTGQSRHWAGWVESELRRRYDPDDPNIADLDFSDVLARLPEIADGVLAAAKARLLAASQKSDEARATLTQFRDAESMTGLAVVETMNGRWDAALAACEAGLADSRCSDSSRRLFQILSARGHYHKALSTATHQIEEEIVPPSGPPGVDAGLLRQAWSDILLVVESMDEIAWASNSEFVADIVAACAAMLGKQKEALTILRSAVQRQPTSQALNASLEVIAAQCGQFDVALEANKRLDRSDTQILHRIAFLYEVGKQRRQCVALAEQELSEISHAHELFGPVLVLAARAARDMAREDLVKLWLDLLESDENLLPHAAVLNYFLSISKSPLSTADALAALAQRHDDLGRPLPTAICLFEVADPAEETQALTLLDVVKELRAHSRLAPGMSVHIGMALVTLKKWDALLELCEEAEREFDGNPRLLAFKGLALDRLGNTQGARQVLKNMLDGGITDSLALRTYVNIMVRCGFLDEALEAAEQILDTASSTAQMRDCIRLLFNLVQTKNPHDPRLLNLAIRIGELADPTNEVEEGLFLTMALVGTSTVNEALSAEKQEEIRERAKAFFEKFPNSNVLRRIDTEDASSDQLLQRLKEITGVTDESLKAQARMEREMRDGRLPIPFAWRTRLALPNIRDQLHLWEVSKQASPDDKQFHLLMETMDWEPKCEADVRGKIPLVDLTTLVLLLDLDLLDALFTHFATVAIAQSTLAEISTLCQVFSGSPGRDKCLDLQTRLRGKLGQITQPIVQSPDEEEIEAQSGIPVSATEIKTLCTAHGYFLYSDDLIFRVWCLGDAVTKGSMSTLDLLEVLEEKEIIDRGQAARAIAKLCAWNVGVKILLKHQLAIVPQGAITARNIFEGVEKLQDDEDFMAIATGIWDFRSDFVRSFQHIAAVLRGLTEEPTISSQVVASFAGVWFLKAKIRPEAPHPPLTLLSNLILAVTASRVGSSVTSKPEALRRLMQVFIYLVELEFGDRMDEATEKHAYQELARAAVEIDARGGQGQPPLHEWLLAGFEAGTSPHEIFTDAYNETYTNLAVRAEQQGR